MQGKIKFEIVSGLYCDFLGELVDRGFCIWTIESTEFGLTACCYACDYKAISRLAGNFQCRTKIIRKKGLYFKARKIFKRKSIVLGTALIFFYMFVFSHIIWRVDVISPSEKITEDVYSMLYAYDICAGSIFSQEKNSYVRQQIFLTVDNVGYITMNFSGGILTCKIDPAISKLPYLEDSTDGNIVASESGVIEDLRVYKGFSQIQRGQSVYKGDILVSATYIDRNGTLQQVMPRAYIKALCEKEYTVQVDFEKDILMRTGECEKMTSLKMLGKSINIGKADIKKWEKYDTERYCQNLSFMGFALPVTAETVKHYKKEMTHISRDEKSAYSTGVKIIEEMIKGDISFIEAENKEYRYMADDSSVTVICTVNGYYDIAKHNKY